MLIELIIEGPDAVSFLQGYVTNDLSSIQPKVGQPMAITNIQGRVIANGWSYGKTDQVNLVIHPTVENIVREHLNKYMVFAKSTILETTAVVYPFETPIEGGINLKPLNWYLHTKPNSANNLDEMCVMAEFPVITEPTSGQFLPQMLALTDFGTVSFAKGCYLGQEIVARAEHRGAIKRKLKSISVIDDLTPIGAQIRDQDDKKCTVITQFQNQALVVGQV